MYTNTIEIKTNVEPLVVVCDNQLLNYSIQNPDSPFLCVLDLCTCTAVLYVRV